MNRAAYIKFVLVLISAVTVFHFCILLKLIPYTVVWGGRLQSDAQMYSFEIISVLINLFLLLTLCMKGNYIKLKFHKKVVTTLLWIFFLIFCLNTLGNLLAKTNFEKLFAGVTLLLAFALGAILLKKEESQLPAKN